jgi:chromosomal replication initiator protein
MVITETGYSKLSPYVIPGLKFSSMPTLDQEYKAQAILSKISEHFNISVQDIVSPLRKRNIVVARYWAIWFIRSYTDLSLKHIGRLLGNRDHTSILAATQKVYDQIKAKHCNLFKDQYEILKLII